MAPKRHFVRRAKNVILRSPAKPLEDLLNAPSDESIDALYLG